MEREGEKEGGREGENGDNTSGTGPARNLLPSLITTTPNAMECDLEIKNNDTFGFRIPGTDIKIIIRTIKKKEKAWGS